MNYKYQTQRIIFPAGAKNEEFSFTLDSNFETLTGLIFVPNGNMPNFVAVKHDNEFIVNPVVGTILSAPNASKVNANFFFPVWKRAKGSRIYVQLMHDGTADDLYIDVVLRLENKAIKPAVLYNFQSYSHSAAIAADNITSKNIVINSAYSKIIGICATSPDTLPTDGIVSVSLRGEDEYFIKQVPEKMLMHNSGLNVKENFFPIEISTEKASELNIEFGVKLLGAAQTFNFIHTLLFEKNNA